MVDEVKLDKLGLLVTHQRPQPSNPKMNSQQKTGITVTNSLQKVIEITLSEKELVDDNSHVDEIKNHIKTGSYQINYEQLAKKLYPFF
jgi:anti-sigma28 factor (negative regulator of flagellin synthesis)